MNHMPFHCLSRLCAAGLLLVLGGGCSLLRGPETPHPVFYSLDNARVAAAGASSRTAPSPESAATLIVNPTQAASGFDSQRIIYVRENHKLEYFANSEWVDAPARMLAPLIVAAIESGGAFRAVVMSPSVAAGDLRLETAIARLQHDFGSYPSRVRFTLRAYIVDNKSRRILAWREFDETVTAASEDPYGGVIAANLAVRNALGQLADFCSEAAVAWHPRSGEAP
jgi:cholesterol transport system auxiliary component